MMTFAVLGSGFGLYGYLPALIQAGVRRIVLPGRYRARFLERPELASFAPHLQWEADEDSALDRADGVVLALRPFDQSSWIPRCLARPNIRNMLLEKPLACSPAEAARLHADLVRSDKAFRVGYTFRFTAWGERLLSDWDPASEGIEGLSIRWDFLAHHFRHGLDTWKRSNAAGGGAIRFYGIQLIALLAEIGYSEVAWSRAYGDSSDQIEKWNAVFAGAGLPRCEILVDTRSAVGRFRVEPTLGPVVDSGAPLAVDQNDPFGSGIAADRPRRLDGRVPILSRLFASLDEPGVEYYRHYAAAIELWRVAEESTVFEITAGNG